MDTYVFINDITSEITGPHTKDEVNKLIDQAKDAGLLYGRDYYIDAYKGKTSLVPKRKPV